MFDLVKDADINTSILLKDYVIKSFYNAVSFYQNHTIPCK